MMLWSKKIVSLFFSSSFLSCYIFKLYSDFIDQWTKERFQRLFVLVLGSIVTFFRINVSEFRSDLSDNVRDIIRVDDTKNLTLLDREKRS